MLDRCNNPNCKAYKNYGRRGIRVEWKSFESFAADMGERPPGAEIDRVDVNKGYSKENCRWSSKKDNARYKRSTILSLSQVEELRSLYATGKYTQSELGGHFHIDQTTVSQVVRGKTWI